MTMEFVILKSFTNYIEANIVMRSLEAEGIRCWLKDENTVTIDPILTNAVGGIKLMVTKEQYERAFELLNKMDTDRRQRYRCPFCGSANIEQITSPRDVSTWFGALSGFFLGNYPLTVSKIWRCFNCSREFKQPAESEAANE